MTIRVLIVDDQAAIRDGLRMRLALESDVQVVGTASDGLEALRWAHKLNPDVVVMDVEMPHMDGIAATEALHFVAPLSVVVILSIYDSPRLRERAHEAGAAAFVAKQAGDAVLLAAIRTAAVPDRKDRTAPDK